MNPSFIVWFLSWFFIFAESGVRNSPTSHGWNHVKLGFIYFRWGLLSGGQAVESHNSALWWWPLPRIMQPATSAAAAAEQPGQPDNAQTARPARVSLTMRSTKNALSSSLSDLSSSSGSSITRATVTPMCQIKCDLIQEQQLLPQLHQQQEVIARERKQLPHQKRLLVTAV